MNPAGTGKVVTPATRFTVTLCYGVFVRMIHLPKETLRWNAALAGTHGKRDETWDHGSWDRKRRIVLKRREIIHLQVFFHLFQEHLDTSFQLLGAKDRVVFRIGIPRSR